MPVMIYGVFDNKLKYGSNIEGSGGVQVYKGVVRGLLRQKTPPRPCEGAQQLFVQRLQAVMSPGSCLLGSGC